MIVYLNGQFLPKEKAVISPDDRGFIFSDGVYEVIRSYRGKLFRMDDHLERLGRSLSAIRIEGFSKEKLQDICKSLLTKNHLQEADATVYVQVTRGEAIRKHAFPPETPAPTVYAFCAPFTPSLENQREGVKVILAHDIRWLRCDIKAVGLLANVLANQEAMEKGASEAIFMRNGAITEGSCTNFCAVFDGVVVTHPLSQYILGGITRKVVLELCQELSIPVRETPILVSDLDRADELMIIGTTVEVTPVVYVEDKKVGDGGPGPITLRLSKAFQDLATGN